MTRIRNLETQLRMAQVACMHAIPRPLAPTVDMEVAGVDSQAPERVFQLANGELLPAIAGG
jgi:hypothetical protein